jgi:hypothetical protein
VNNLILFFMAIELHCVYTPHFLNPSVMGHLGYFQSLATVNKYVCTLS